jgi:hypothetical protein
MAGSVEDLRARVFGLLVACPLDDRGTGAASQSCTLESARQLPLRERAAWVKSLSIEELKRILAEHDECFKSLEKTRYFRSVKPE